VVVVPIYRKGDKTDCNNYRSISLLSTTYKFLSNILLQSLTPYAEGFFSVVFDARRQLLIIYSAIVKYVRKYENTMKQCISYL